MPKTQRSVVLWCPGWPSLGEGQTIAASFYIETLSSDLAKAIKKVMATVWCCPSLLGYHGCALHCFLLLSCGKRGHVPWAPIVQYSRSPGA